MTPALAVRRGVHVLVVAVADGVRVRLAVERALRDLGWVAAWSPADADVLAVCGTPAAAEADAIERLWQQLPGPRSRVDLATADDVVAPLARCAAALDDDALQAVLARQADDAAPDAGEDGAGTEHDGQGETDHESDHGDGGEMGHEGGHDEMNHDGMDHGGHGGMDMSGPAGIPLAEGADDDRDGLEMDAWHVVLGPGLPGWPAGLVLRATLHGDVVTALETVAALASGSPGDPSGLDGPGDPDGPVPHAALLADAAATVLDLAGWAAVASSARRARDGLLDGRETGPVADDLARLARRVRRSVLLRWSLQGPGRRGDDPRPSAGRVVRLRLLALLDTAAALLRDPAYPVPPQPGDWTASLADLATGQEVGTLRLLVASLALDARAVVAHA